MAGTGGRWRGDLSELANQFAHWRRTRAPGARIPEWLWQWAGEAAAQHGVSRTATTLSLRYQDLKQRVAGKTSPPASRQENSQAVDFVQLNPAAPTIPCQCTIELEKPCGSRLRVELKGSRLDIESLARGFWESA